MKIHDEKRAEIAELKQLVVRFEALSNLTSFDLKHGLSSGTAGTLPIEVTKESIASLIQMTTEIFLRVDCNDAERKRLWDSMWAEINAIPKATNIELEAEDRFASIVAGIVKNKEKSLLGFDE